jgi:hypothetical protein
MAVICNVAPCQGESFGPPQTLTGAPAMATTPTWRDNRPHPEERALARVSKDGHRLPWLETPRCARLLTMRTGQRFHRILRRDIGFFRTSLIALALAPRATAQQPEPDAPDKGALVAGRRRRPLDQQ